MVLVDRLSTVVLSVITLAAACSAVVAGTALPAGASPQPVGTWGSVQQVPGLAALDVDQESVVDSVSCPSAGNCTAVGTYRNGGYEGFVVSEVNGSWGTARPVPGLAALNAGNTASFNSVSCASAGNCAAGGYYTDSAGHEQGFVVDEVKGSWGMAQEVPGLAALNVGTYSGPSPAGDFDAAWVSSVSCASAGNCTAGGSYLFSSLAGSGQAFVVDEVNGSWGTAEEVPGSAALNAGGSAWVNSVSCASAGNCAAGGTYEDSASEHQPFVVDEVNGSWGTAEEVPGSAALNAAGSVSSVSCPSPGNCTAVGGDWTGAGQAFVVDEVSGSWGMAKEVPGSAALDVGGGASLDSVSCPSLGNCTAVGHTTYPAVSGQPVPQAFSVSESGGSWGTAQVLPGVDTGKDATFFYDLSLSCGSAGNCVAGGAYFSGPAVIPFLAEEAGGSWTTAQPPGLASLDLGLGHAAPDVGAGAELSVSCASAGNCAAGGMYPAFLVNEKPSTNTVLALSAAKVTYGKEQAERVFIAVTAASSGTPSGTVTVKAGTAVVCGNLTLAAGLASCTLPATRLPGGTWHLTASYSGSGWASTSAARTLTVAKAASKITLALSAAKVTYGHEQSERLTVSVTGQYGQTPAGKVAVKSGKTAVCTITLTAGKGSCTLAARKLPAGTRTLIAVYPGNHDYTGASSARKTLKVVT